eukprot:5530659-Lingulodinium_polyedra.AAC.1
MDALTVCLTDPWCEGREDLRQLRAAAWAARPPSDHLAVTLQHQQARRFVCRQPAVCAKQPRVGLEPV